LRTSSGEENSMLDVLVVCAAAAVGLFIAYDRLTNRI